MNKKHLGLYLLLTGILIGVDRLTKMWALQLVDEYIVTPFFSLDTVFNPGVSWGLLHNFPHPFIKLAIMLSTMAIIFALASYAYGRMQHKKIIIAEVLVIAGALSNWYDRLFWPGVIDFIQVHYNYWYFPAFNIADMAIVVGVFGMIYVYLFQD